MGISGSFKLHAAFNENGKVAEVKFLYKATWERCACEHDGHPTHSDCNETNICQCIGEVRYGHGDTWSDPKQVDASIECANEAFGTDPLFRQGKECQCKQGATTTSTTTTTTTATSTTTTSEATWERCA